MNERQPPPVLVTRPEDLDGGAVLAVAAGRPVEVAPALLEQVAARRSDVREALTGAAPVYGVTTGMGAQGAVRLDDEARERHSRRLLLGRAVGGPPWLGREEVRALLAVRLRDFLTGDAGVSAELCRWLATLLDHDVLPAVPRDASASAGEIVPLAHAFGHLAGASQVLGPDGTATDAGPVVAPLEPPTLGVKEGVALLQGRPIATGLALLRAAEAGRLARQWVAVAAAELQLVRAAPGPYRAEMARGDDVLAEVLDRLRTLRGPVSDPRDVQVPVSLRVVGPVLAAVERAASEVLAAAERSLAGVSDSPAYLSDGEFASTPGFHAVDLAVALDGLRVTLVHAAQNGAARLHRLLDVRHNGRSPQLAFRPGEAGLVVVHKQVVGEVQRLATEVPAVLQGTDTALGQEDVQSGAPAAAEQVRRALAVGRRVLAAEMLAVHQARLVGGRPQGSHELEVLLDTAALVLPSDPSDQPRGRMLEALVELITDGWADPSSRAGPASAG